MSRRENIKQLASPTTSELVLSNIAAIGAYDTGSGAYDTIAQRPAQSNVELDRVYEFLNRNLFAGILPPCLITLQRTRGAYGYFSGARFSNTNKSSEIVDEIALNPAYFASRSLTEVLATLAHEMVHLWQHHFGKPSRGGYHNAEWARAMEYIGLIPSSTEAPGGTRTGQRVSHYIQPGGCFELACAAYLASETVTLFQDRSFRNSFGGDREAGADGGPGNGNDSRLERADRERERKAASKTKFTCPRCERNAWASRATKLLCGNEQCDQEGMVPSVGRATSRAAYTIDIENEQR